MPDILSFIGLNEREIERVRELAVRRGLTVERLVIQALRLYSDVDSKLSAGETMHFSGDEARAREFAGPLVSGRK